MSRFQRSSDGPMPYGPSGQPTPPDAPKPPETASPPDSTPPAWGAPTSEVPPTTPPTWGPPAGGEVPPPFAPPPPPSGGPTPGFGAPPPVAQWAPPPGAYATTVPGAPGLQYGRTLDRVMAWILDSFIVGIPSFIVTIFVVGAAAGSFARLSGPVLVANVISIGISVLYFVAFWTGSSRATPGMRLMKLQMGDAATGAVPTVQQGLIRWFSLGGAISIASAIPVLGTFVGFVAFIWELLLLATTATSPTKQGIHDRIANTALVQPVGADTPAKTCLGILVVLFVLWIVGIVALIALGGQVSSILSSVGESI